LKRDTKPDGGVLSAIAGEASAAKESTVAVATEERRERIMAGGRVEGMRWGRPPTGGSRDDHQKSGFLAIDY
jgi:hypothetical protein